MDDTPFKLALHRREMTDEILACAIDVHRALGPGLLESAYCACLEIEMRTRGMRFAREVAVDIDYRGVLVQNAFRADFIVGGQVVVEVKAIRALESVHEAQVLTYLRLTGLEIGLLLNFHMPSMRKGIRRIVRSRHPLSTPSSS